MREDSGSGSWTKAARVLLLALAVVGAGCDAGVDEEEATGSEAGAVGEPATAPTPLAGEAPAGTPPAAEAPAGSVHVSLVDYRIEMPASLPAGMTTFHVVNNGTHEHGFEVEGQGIEEELEPRLEPGQTGTLEVDLQPGTYTVYCPVGDHRGRGMELTLTVG